MNKIEREKSREFSAKKHTRINSQDATLTHKQLLTALRKHELILDVGGLTNEQIDAVLKAYSDIVFESCLMNIAVKLPTLGTFKPFKKKGFKGGMRTIPEKGVHQRIGKDTKRVEYYVEPKPDYSIIKFDISPTLNKQFRALTEEQLP